MNSQILVKRKWFTDKSTIGALTFDDLSMFTLEDTVRENQPKIPGATAIPAGEYEIVISYSNRFGKLMPLLLNVPNFKGVRIHSGNKPEHTEGCPLVGYKYSQDMPDVVFESRRAYNDLFDKIKDAINYGKIWLNIS